MSELKPSELWKAIILYGLNQASYEMALGKVLIDEAKRGETEIRREQLSKEFLNSHMERLTSFIYLNVI